MENIASVPIIAIIPAAGYAKRLVSQKGSKELISVGPTFHAVSKQTPVINCVLVSLRYAGVTDVVVVLRRSKWDIVDFLSTSAWGDFNFRYVVTRGTSGVPYSIALALPIASGAIVVCGFPDVLFRPRSAIQSMLCRLLDGETDVVLGIFPTDRPQKMDIVTLGPGKEVQAIEVKPKSEQSGYTWILAVWRPQFSSFIHKHLSSKAVTLDAIQSPAAEIHLGHVFQAALRRGWRIKAEVFRKGAVLDIGTPDDLARSKHWRP